MFIADAANSVVREVVKASGDIFTVAGTGGVAGYSGDTQAATSAELNNPQSVAVDSAGDIFIADSGNQVIREVVKSSGDIFTVAGTGQSAGNTGDNGLATSAQLNDPTGVALDSAGDIFIADNGNMVIREVVQASGDIILVAGNYSPGYSGDTGAATSAELYYPYGIALDGAGDIFFSDNGNRVVREVVKSSGDIFTVAGIGGQVGYTGDGGPATSAKLSYPYGVAVDGSGDIFIGDYGNNVVREVVKASGDIFTVAGNGSPGYSGDGGAASSAQLYEPEGVAVDGSGHFFIADTGNQVVRKVK